MTDTYRRIQWARADSGKESGWEEARACCRGLRLGGHSDWLLPTHYELWTKLYMFYWSATDGDAGHGYPGMNVVSFQVVRFLDGSRQWVSIHNVQLVRACLDGP